MKHTFSLLKRRAALGAACLLAAGLTGACSSAVPTATERFCIQADGAVQAERWLIVRTDGLSTASVSNPSLELDAPGGFCMEMQRNCTAAVLAYPVSKGALQRPYGTVYPYGTTLTRADGFAASIADCAYRGADAGTEHVQDYLSRFNWPRFMELCRQYPDPWQIDAERVLAALTAGKFAKTDVKRRTTR